MSNDLITLSSLDSPYAFHMKACAIPFLSEQEERDLLIQCHNNPEGSEEYKYGCQQLVIHHLRAISKIALKIAQGIHQFKEIISEGILGILDAIKHFDLSKEVRFITYAAWWIKYRINEWIKNSSTVKNCNNIISLNAPVSQNDDSQDLTVEDTIADSSDNFALLEEADSARQQTKLLNDSLSILTERNKEIVLRYSNGETLQAISDDMHISRERVRQIYNRSLERMKDFLAEKHITTINDI